ncbi:MAG: hypothetical protein Q8P63_00980 [Candidatus Nealsonbacteria bacterium]|nr:hypothetical protein [Candidatus Nealsonbacteria bacterium]
MLIAKEGGGDNMQIFPTITTKTKSGWKSKVEEVRILKLKEVSVFLSCLLPQERKELYQALKKTKVQKIPLVHLRDDVELWELDYLREHYQTAIFNTHSGREFPFKNNLDKYKKEIYIENAYYSFDEEELKEFAGICLDFSHLENDRLLRPEIYQQDIKLIEKYPLGCGHISAINSMTNMDKEGSAWRCSHFFENLFEFDYLKRYPLKYFPSIIAIELENSIKDQLKVKEYILNLLA